MIFSTKPLYEVKVARQRPYTHGLPSTGMHQDFPSRAGGKSRKFFAPRQFDIQSPGDHSPMLITMCAGIGPFQAMCEKNLAPHARKPQAHLDLEQQQQQMIARIPAGGKSCFETAFDELAK